MADDLQPLHEYLDRHHVLHLSTWSGAGPHAASLFFARAAGSLELVWISADSTRHSRDLVGEPRAGVAIAESDPGVASIRGVQLSGRAEAPPDRQAELTRLYLSRFPMAAPMVAAAAGHRFWVFRPGWARLIRMDAGVKRNLEWELGAASPEPG